MFYSFQNILIILYFCCTYRYSVTTCVSNLAWQMMNEGRKEPLSITHMHEVYETKVKRLRTRQRNRTEPVQNPRVARAGISPQKTPQKKTATEAQFVQDMTEHLSPNVASETHWQFPCTKRRCNAKLACRRANQRTTKFCLACEIPICETCWWPHHSNKFQITLSEDQVVSKVGTLTEEARRIIQSMQSVSHQVEGDVFELSAVGCEAAEGESPATSGEWEGPAEFRESLKKMTDHIRTVKQNLGIEEEQATGHECTPEESASSTESRIL